MNKTEYKPTMKELKRVYYLKKEIQSLQKTLQKVEAEAILLNIAIKTTELQMQYDKIFTWIFSIDDPLIRLIIKARYLDCYTWNEVADEVGGNNTEYSVKKIAYRYFEKEAIK